jgi:hypothetical protein
VETIGLVSCASKKNPNPRPIPAVERYWPGTYFRDTYRYATRRFDRVFILSAKYGLLRPEDPIEDYNVSLVQADRSFRAEWRERVVAQIKRAIDLERSRIFYVCGRAYWKELIDDIPGEAVLEGTGGIGFQRRWLKEQARDDAFGIFE